jgi:hypothetical protein
MVGMMLDRCCWEWRVLGVWFALAFAFAFALALALSHGYRSFTSVFGRVCSVKQASRWQTSYGGWADVVDGSAVSEQKSGSFSRWSVRELGGGIQPLPLPSPSRSPLPTPYHAASGSLFPERSTQRPLRSPALATRLKATGR